MAKTPSSARPRAPARSRASSRPSRTAAARPATPKAAKPPFVFEALQARYGDCLLLTVPGPRGIVRLLIDGGPSGVFRTFLKPRLDQEIVDKTPLTIDAIMVSHIDEDHILGVLDLFGAIRDADERQAPRPYQPRWLLHNSFDGLIGEGEGGAARTIEGPTVLAGLGGALPNLLQKRESHTARLVLQSYGQGSKLASLAAALKISRNPPDEGLIQFTTDRPRLMRLGDATLTIVGPLKKEIDDLQDKWAKWKAKQKDKEATAALAKYLDRSVPNLSSIVVLMECNGTRVLLTGDARGDHILKGLKQAGLMPTSDPLKVDILKLPHHGSARNLDDDFFEKIHADHYVASGDGTYGNPDLDALKMIENARPEGGYTVHLTYSAESCDATHKDWLKDRKDGPFDPARHAIADIVARWKREGNIKVAEGPVRLEL